MTKDEPSAVAREYAEALRAMDELFSPARSDLQVDMERYRPLRVRLDAAQEAFDAEFGA